MKREPIETDTQIKGFFGEYRWLSNFHLAPVMYDGCVFLSSEHAYQAAKYPKVKWIEATGKSCREVKGWGQLAPIDRTDWGAKRTHVMFEILMMKFLGHKDLRAQLLATGTKELVELNDWGDVFWGVVTKEDGTEEGTNMLGRMLMGVRGMVQVIFT